MRTSVLVLGHKIIKGGPVVIGVASEVVGVGSEGALY
jgi:hypothetical protein